MSDLTNYGETQLLEMFRLFGTFYLALFTSDPGEAGSLAGEVAVGSYARQSAAWAAASGGAMSTNAAITFPRATAPWGTVTHIGLADALTSGNLWWYKALPAGVSVTTGRTVTVDGGDLTLTLA